MPQRKQRAGEFLNQNNLFDFTLPENNSNADIVTTSPTQSRVTGSGGAGAVRDPGPVTGALMNAGETAGDFFGKFGRGVSDFFKSDERKRKGVEPVKSKNPKVPVPSKREMDERNRSADDKLTTEAARAVLNDQTGAKSVTRKNSDGSEISIEGSSIQDMMEQSLNKPTAGDFKDDKVLDFSTPDRDNMTMSKLSLEEEEEPSFLSKVGSFIKSPEFVNFLATTAKTLDPSNKGADMLRGSVQSGIFNKYSDALADPNVDETQIAGYELLSPELRLKAKQNLRDKAKTQQGLEDSQVRNKYLGALGEQARATAGSMVPADVKTLMDQLSLQQKEKESRYDDIARSGEGSFYDKRTGKWIINKGLLNEAAKRATQNSNLSASDRSQVIETLSSKYLQNAMNNYIDVNTKGMEGKEKEQFVKSLNIMNVLSGKDGNLKTTELLRYLDPDQRQAFMQEMSKIEGGLRSGGTLGGQLEGILKHPSHGTVETIKGKKYIYNAHTNGWRPIS